MLSVPALCGIAVLLESGVSVSGKWQHSGKKDYQQWQKEKTYQSAALGVGASGMCHGFAHHIGSKKVIISKGNKKHNYQLMELH